MCMLLLQQPCSSPATTQPLCNSTRLLASNKQVLSHTGEVTLQKVFCLQSCSKVIFFYHVVFIPSLEYLIPLIIVVS